MSELDEYLKFAKELALDAGNIMKKYFRTREMGLEIKKDQTPVTAADKEINMLVINRVKARFPAHGVMGEEESYGMDKDNLWIVDPLDGTNNFSRGIPLFAFSLALVAKGKLLTAVVLDPITERLLYATSGQGAYENGKRLNIKEKSSKDALLISSWVVGGIDNSVFEDKGVHGKFADLFARQSSIEEIDLPIAYALAVVASESLDGVVSSVKTQWDVAAGSLIAQEAGAKVTDLFGNPINRWDKQVNGILAASPEIHKLLLHTIGPMLENSK